MRSVGASGRILRWSEISSRRRGFAESTGRKPDPVSVGPGGVAAAGWFVDSAATPIDNPSEFSSAEVRGSALLTRFGGSGMGGGGFADGSRWCVRHGFR